MKNVSVWHEPEGDMLEVLWEFKEGYFSPTDDDRVLKRTDEEGNLVGFLIHEISTMKGPSSFEFNLSSEENDEETDSVTIASAAEKLQVSERRLRQLARQGRVKGAEKRGRDWLIPTPVEILPGKRGPVGVAGRQ